MLIVDLTESLARFESMARRSCVVGTHAWKKQSILGWHMHYLPATGEEYQNQAESLELRNLQPHNLPDWQTENDHVSHDVDGGIGYPERLAVDADWI